MGRPTSMSVPRVQTRISLRERPKGEIDASLGGQGTFKLEKDAPVRSPARGEVLVRVECLSIDPAMRGWLRDARSYIPPVQLGETMRAGGVGQVVRTGGDDGDLKLQVGDWVTGLLGWQEYATVPAQDVTKISISPRTPASLYLGALGSSGQTAYWGMLDVLKPQPGQTLVVSGAAGSVGSIACQIGKIKGCRVIGIAGGRDKCELLTRELRCDAALDYKSATFASDFKKAVGYLDCFFDNVGGDVLDLALTRLKPGARIALCGAISDYNKDAPQGLRQYQNLIAQRGTMQGFIVFDYVKRYGEAAKDLTEWMASGKLRIKETRVDGLEKAPSALVGLFAGSNVGKAFVQVARPTSHL